MYCSFSFGVKISDEVIRFFPLQISEQKRAISLSLGSECPLLIPWILKFLNIIRPKIGSSWFASSWISTGKMFLCSCGLTRAVWRRVRASGFSPGVWKVQLGWQWCLPLDFSINVLITSSSDISKEKMYIFLNIQLTKLKLISGCVSRVFLYFCGATCCRSQQVALGCEGDFSLPRR